MACSGAAGLGMCLDWRERGVFVRVPGLSFRCLSSKFILFSFLNIE